jgi:glycine oxidase
MKVVIIGAGVAGLAIGWRLLQQGCSVIILERAQPGRGATWAAAGMLAVTAEMEDAAEPERALAIRSNELWPAFAAELEQAAGQRVGFTRSGALLLAADAAALEAMRPRGQVLDSAQVAALAPGLSPQPGALWVADEAHVDSRALGQALTAAFLKAGGRLMPHEAVVRIEENAGRASAVLTPFGRYPADVFLIAAGAWTGTLEDLPVRPVKGEMIALVPPPGAALPEAVIWGEGVYLVPRNGRLLVGATVQEAGFDTSLTDAARGHLWARAQSLIPASADWTLVEHWAGLRPATPDGLPLLGPLALPNLFVAGGQFRNGILFAPAIAGHMCDVMLGQASVIPDFDPLRFSSQGFP